MQHPAKPSDDAWMGNMLVDPARGKAHAAGPEERMGRKDLFDLMQQKILLQAQHGGHSSQVIQYPNPFSLLHLQWYRKSFTRAESCNIVVNCQRAVESC